MQHLRIKNKVKDLRLAHGFSQEALGKEVGISKWGIGLLEREECNPSQEVAEEMSHLFNLPIGKIFFIKGLDEGE